MDAIDDTLKSAVLAEKQPRKPETGMIGVFFNHEFPFGHSDPTQCEVQGRQLTGHVLSLRVLFVADSQMTVFRSFALFTLHARVVNTLRWEGNQAPTYATFSSTLSTVRWF